MRRVNWPLWSGVLLALCALFSYPLVFVRWPATRDLPWVNFLLFGAAAVSAIVGVRRAFAPGRRWLSKMLGVVGAALVVTVFGAFVFGVIVVPRQLPASLMAPHMGQRAPDFTLLDVNSTTVSLSELLSTPLGSRAPKGVLLIFYRGYW
jgi:hypothetical protein